MDIPHLTAAVWQVFQPYLPLLAAKGVEELGKRAVGELWEAVKKCFAQKDETKKLADKLLASPNDPAVQGAFQSIICANCWKRTPNLPAPWLGWSRRRGSGARRFDRHWSTSHWREQRCRKQHLLAVPSSL